jgi:mannose-6-phosphate isomerase-like protein (cupin superfamily)
MKIIKREASSIQKEQAHGGSGARKVLTTNEHTTGENLDAITHGYLPAGASFDWHHHQNIDEIMIVLTGEGEVSDEDGSYEYQPGDVYIFPADIQHMIHNPTNIEHEMIFIRVRI